MATLRKRGKRWQAIIRKSGQKPVVKTFINKAQAEIWARGVETDMDRQAWEDLDRKHKIIVLRDRKHPTEKQGNDQEVPLLPDAYRGRPITGI